MKKKLLFTLLFCSLFQSILFKTPLEAVRKKRPFTCQEEADFYLNKHYCLGCKYYNQEDWKEASKAFEKVIYFFPSTEKAVEASFYLGVCYYEMKEYDFANIEFSNYLKAATHPVYFQEAVQYKFCMAERLKCGMKRRPFTVRYLPKCLKAEDLALTIYDEVVVALPNHELTVQALHSKADLLRKMREYRQCIETYQTIIRRFPSNPTVPVCYMEIANTYIEQSRYEFQNPDILALAELNAKKFSEDFPRDENVPYVNDSVMRIKESYARGLFNLGLFYERTGHPEAAMIYFQTLIEKFPDTDVARYTSSRSMILGDQLNQEILMEYEPIQENACQEKSDLCQEEQIVSPQQEGSCHGEPCCAE